MNLNFAEERNRRSRGTDKRHREQGKHVFRSDPNGAYSLVVDTAAKSLGFLSDKNKCLEELVERFSEKEKEIKQQNDEYNSKLISMQVFHALFLRT